MAQSKLEILISAINEASGPIRDVAQEIESMQERARNTLEVGERLTNFGQQYTNNVSRPIMEGLGASVNAAIELESAMSDTNKALGVQPNTDGARALQAEVVALSAELGQMPTTIADFYAEAGKLGVARNQIGDYTRLVNQAGVAWDMTGEEAGGAVATLTNVMGLFDSQTGMVDLQGLSQLGDTINYLADTGATSERAIASVLQRSGSTMRMFGLLNEEGAALATGFLNLGYPPEVVGTAMNAMLPKLQNATQQTEGFQEALASIDLPAAQFEKMVAEDATGAITTLLEAAQKSGDTGIFQALFGTGSDSALLTAATQNLDNFKATLESIGNVQSGGMEASYENRLKTTQAQMESFRAQMFILGASIGSAILPAINSILSALTPLVSGFAEFAAAHPGIIKVGVAIALAAAAIGPLIIGIGMVVSAIGGMMSAMAAWQAFQLALAAGQYPGLVAAANAVRGIVSAITSAAALAGILLSVVYAVFSIGAALTGTSFTFQEFIAVIQSSLAAMPANLAQVPAAIAAIFQAMLFQVQMAFFNLRLSAQMAFQGIQTTIAGIVAQISATFQSMGMAFAMVWAMIRAQAVAAIQGVVAAITGGTAAAVGAVRAMGSQMVSAVMAIASQMVAAGRNIVTSIAQGIMSGAGAVRSAISSVASMVRGALPFSPPEWGPLSDIMSSGGNIVNSIASGIVPGPLQSAMSNAMSPVGSMMSAPSASPIPLGNSGGGIAPQGSSGGMSLTYAPQVTLGPGANPQDFRAMLEEHRDEIGRLMQDLQRRDARINYAGA